jgi:hypothetical protein
MKTVTYVLAAFAAFAALPAHSAEELPEPKKLTIDRGLTHKQAQPLLQAARRYYAFWNTGDEAYARRRSRRTSWT